MRGRCRRAPFTCEMKGQGPEALSLLTVAQ